MSEKSERDRELGREEERKREKERESKCIGRISRRGQLLQ